MKNSKNSASFKQQSNAIAVLQLQKGDTFKERYSDLTHTVIARVKNHIKLRRSDGVKHTWTSNKKAVNTEKWIWFRDFTKYVELV